MSKDYCGDVTLAMDECVKVATGGQQNRAEGSGAITLEAREPV